jgi:Xaa-Pro aminopeptidase
MTRSFVIGGPDAADDVAREILPLVTQAQAAAVAAVGPGVEAKAIDDACRSIITEAGFGEAFRHGTGHGVGLDIHELPSIRKDNAAILQAGQVLTVEPGVYLPGVGGVRVEDLVVVTDSGCRPLTLSPKLSL